MNYYKHHIGDYAAATAHLSMLEDAAYSRLLRLYYAMEKPIPAEARAVYRLVRATGKAEREAVDAVLVEFFTLAQDGYHQKRCDEEIEHRAQVADINRTSGQKGGRPRKTETVIDENRNGFQVVGIESAQSVEKNSSVHNLRSATNSVDHDVSACLQTNAETETVSENNPSHKPLANNYKEQEQEQDQNQKKGRASAPDIPDWLPESVWHDWHAFRNTRKGWTTRAQQLSLRTLTELRKHGHDPAAVIEQSIERGWTGLFPVRPPSADPRGSPQKPPIAQQFSAKTYTGTADDELPDYLRTGTSEPQAKAVSGGLR